MRNIVILLEALVDEINLISLRSFLVNHFVTLYENRALKQFTQKASSKKYLEYLKKQRRSF